MSETFFFLSWKFMVITRLLEISLTRRFLFAFGKYSYGILANFHMESTGEHTFGN